MIRSILLLLSLMLIAAPAYAGDEVKKDDQVLMDLSAETWVVTQTARVVISVEAAVTGSTAGSAKTEMNKAVDTMVKADWRLTDFNRNQDQTGMERWSAQFEARIPESQLSGLNENAKKLSKAGMQLSVNTIDFSPTLAETEAAYGQLRTQIYKSTKDQLEALNSAIPGRNYRVAMINFTNSSPGDAQPRQLLGRGMKMMAMAENSDSAGSSPSLERAEKINLTAHVTFAALPTGTAK
ncbi:MAG: SIMPL domain-containing protein [Alphaproteobacteria bacterium]|nr:SIMPL domain-containing protein [Alphaproteobacteria bacterium]